jgi:hypothetical protein
MIKSPNFDSAMRAAEMALHRPHDFVRPDVTLSILAVEMRPHSHFHLVFLPDPRLTGAYPKSVSLAKRLPGSIWLFVSLVLNMRVSAFKGTWEENRRPYVVLAPDAYVCIQGQTTVVTCGECNRKVDVNKYVTGISTEATVDSPPGSATINLSIPDTDVNEFYVDGNFVIIPMMELEIYAKGYYTIGGMPQYYKIFWGVTSFTIGCKDILYWWEKTNVTTNPAFIGKEGASTGYTLFQNQFAGLNPYTIIIALAREAMGDFSITDGSFMSYKPEAGPEEPVVGQYAKDIMAYWQLKFGNMWNALVLYGTSGTAYTFQGDSDVSPLQISSTIFRAEAEALAENRITADVKVQPGEIAAFKVDMSRAGDVQFFQNDTQTKLSCALTARDQILYEFYCDTTGDIIFKPPFYNLNVIPNKPVSWINDFEIIDDAINDSEQEVVTHMTSSGNAFGGVVDCGLTDEITIPRTGVIDWHLLKRYGWKRQDFQCEWAGNPKKLFWFLVDYLDRVNAKRHNGTVTIPMRPELRMGFPVWIPYYDSFYYVSGISHQYSPGGQATTTLTLIAKRSKFLAPANMGVIERVPGKSKVEVEEEKGGMKQKRYFMSHTYQVSFSGSVGQTTGLGEENKQDDSQPLIIRDPNTGKLLGYPNVVMVYRTTYSGIPMSKQQSANGRSAGKSKQQPKKPPKYTYDYCVNETFKQLRSDQKAAAVSKIRHHRYEAGMTNAGLYDYAVDANGDFKEMVLVPVTSIRWGTGSDDPSDITGALQKSAPTKKGSPKSKDDPQSAEAYMKQRDAEFDKQIADVDKKLKGAKGHEKEGLLAQVKIKGKQWKDAKDDFSRTVSKNHGGKPVELDQYNGQEKQKMATADALRAELDALNKQVSELQAKKSQLSVSKKDDLRLMEQINVSVRPVSDEFGFEVIGHNRYGRGVFVDRGHVKLASAGANSNELRIQFSASSGTLTTNPPNSKFISPQANTFSQMFEKMQPEDWVTGAASYNDKTHVQLTSANTYSSAINRTIEAPSGKGAVFAEADTLRRAKTLRELQPTLQSGLDEVGFPACSCMLNRFQWFSVLPKDVLRKILSITTTQRETVVVYDLVRYTYIDANGNETDQPVTFYSRALDPLHTVLNEIPIQEQRPNQLVAIYVRKDDSGNIVDTIRKNATVGRDMPLQLDANGSAEQQAATDAKKNTMDRVSDYSSMTNQEFIDMLNSNHPMLGSEVGLTSFPDFFKQLNAYLIKKFSDEYEQNSQRESADIGLDLGIEVVGATVPTYTNPDSVLGASGGSLFDKAAQGDVNALNALQNQANWNFGATQQASKTFEQAAKDFTNTVDNIGKQAKSDTSVWKDGRFVEVSTGKKSNKPQIQPVTPLTRDFVTNPNLTPDSYADATPTGQKTSDMSLGKPPVPKGPGVT